jgi:predicted acyltransferase
MNQPLFARAILRPQHMSSTPVAGAGPAPSSGNNAPPRADRLVSLDVFRGITIAGMILVNNNGDWDAAYWPLLHSKWNGWTPTDLVFPFFLFIVGVSMVLSISSRLARGDSRGKIMQHALVRGAILFALGVFLNGFPNRYNPHTLRIEGVLQRIAICYVISAVFVIYTGNRSRITAIVVCLVSYWIIMRYIPVPGYGVPTHDVPLLDPDGNLAAWLDRKLLMGHLYEGTRDPEGVLSTIPSVATSLLGVMTGEWLRSKASSLQKAAWMLVAGLAGLCAGEFFNIWFPINKKLWTSSFVLFTAGFALVFLALFYWLLDYRKSRGPWTMPPLVFGMNSIAAYVFSELLAIFLGIWRIHLPQDGYTDLQAIIYNNIFTSRDSPPSANASLMFSLSFVLVCWLAMWPLYRKRIFLKI